MNEKYESVDVLFFQSVPYEGCWLLSNALLQLASFIDLNGFKAKVVHLGINYDYKKTVLENVMKYKPRYVCIDLRWFGTLYTTLEIAKLVKTINKNVVTITGGHTATYFNREIILTCPFLDIIIKGDAELPLLNILKNKEMVNCTFRNKDNIIQQPITYTQEQSDLKGLHLTNLEKILDSTNEILLMQPKQLKSPLYPRAFIWSGKGCNYNCIYCGARYDSQKILFNRKHPIFRNVKDVLRDIEEFSKMGIVTFEFDFDPFVKDETFYLSLFKTIKSSNFNCVFNSWTLPSAELLESLHNSFKNVIVTMSPETFNESVRKYLAENNLGRPYYSNVELINCIENVKVFNNLYLELYLVAGLPLKTDISFKTNLEFANFLKKRYSSVFMKKQGYRSINCLPLQIEPSTFMDDASNQLVTQSGMTIYRKGFNDFYDFSKRDFFHLPRNVFGLDPSSTIKIKHNVNLFNKSMDKTDWKNNIIRLKGIFKKLKDTTL